MHLRPGFIHALSSSLTLALRAKLGEQVISLGINRCGRGSRRMMMIVARTRGWGRRNRSRHRSRSRMPRIYWTMVVIRVLLNPLIASPSPSSTYAWKRQTPRARGLSAPHGYAGRFSCLSNPSSCAFLPRWKRKGKRGGKQGKGNA